MSSAVTGAPKVVDGEVLLAEQSVQRGFRHIPRDQCHGD